MKTISELAREAGIRDCTCNGTKGCLERFAELVRADERGRMCEQCKERLNEKSESNEANKSAVLGESGQAG